MILPAFVYHCIFFFTEIVIPYWILRTDYTNYALAYSCVNLDDDMRAGMFQLTKSRSNYKTSVKSLLNTNFAYLAVYSWKLSRTKELLPASQDFIAEEMSLVQVLEEQYFVETDQSEDACFYLPDLTLEEPVIFIGQCNENLPTMQNFDANRVSSMKCFFFTNKDVYLPISLRYEVASRKFCDI